MKIDRRRLFSIFGGALLAGRAWPAQAAARASMAVSVLALTEGICKYPIGDPTDPDFAFCGRDVFRGPYCRGHARLAYQSRAEIAATRRFPDR